jgi:hypothetical protein
MLENIPNAKRIVFNDAASIDSHGKNMNLCYKYVLVHGISWYEHFGVILVNKSSRQLLDNFKEMLEQNFNWCHTLLSRIHCLISSVMKTGGFDVIGHGFFFTKRCVLILVLCGVL